MKSCTPSRPVKTVPKQTFRTYAEFQARRVLTQMDRDPDSPSYGCFDRNFWHYKIRDFPSSILQQGVFTLEALRRGYISVGTTPRQIEEWSVACINALARQVDRAGGVDEYFPFERSYPAAAFGLYCVARVLSDWQTDRPELLERINWDGLNRLTRHVANRIELEAINQYAAGVAGMALAHALPEILLSREVVTYHVDRLLTSQHEEGWFNEYEGPDCGYLTVTLDALVDIFDATGYDRALKAIDRIVEFLAGLLGVDGELPWTLNSRNTDYVVPYGLVRTAARNATAAYLVQIFFADVDKPCHFIWSVDDRYHAHYVYASVVRSLPHLDAMRSAEAPAPQRRSWLPGCGYWVVHNQVGYTLYVAARKGGLVRVHKADGTQTEVDYGWRIRDGRKIWITNWWSAHWLIDVADDRLVIEGRLQACRFHRSSPLRHIVLRVLSWLARDRLTPLLRRVMIFRPGRPRGPFYRREIHLAPNGFSITDRFDVMAGKVAVPAPRQNMRHVASADNFHPEECRTTLLGDALLPLDYGGERKIQWRSSQVAAETVRASGVCE